MIDVALHSRGPTPLLRYDGPFKDEDLSFGETPKVIGKFYFWDECWQLHGPYDSTDDARIALDLYFDSL